MWEQPTGCDSMRSKARFYILSINPLRAIWKFKTADDKEISFTEIIRHRNPVFAKQTTTKKDLASTIINGIRHSG